MIIKSQEEEQGIKKAAKLVSKTLAYLAQLIQPGVTGDKLDKAAFEFITDHGAIPAFKGYRGYPASICLSLDHEVVHGIPTRDKVIKENMLVSVDVGVVLNGFVGDCAYTFVVGDDIDPIKLAVAETTYEALKRGISQAIAGNRIGDIGFAIEDYVEGERGFYVVRDLVGHGVGKALHEDPQVPNYGKRGQGKRLKEGLVIAIEPMVNAGTRSVNVLPDRWTIITADKSPSAHYEHMVIVRKGKPEVITTFDEIEKNFPAPFRKVSQN